MAKTKTPFLSFGSKGTVGGVLTSQKRGRDTILRGTPRPTDPYSLAQAYQRWLYRDYAYLWTLLSNSEKQVYRTRGSRYHITGFSQFMRESLKNYTDIAGIWHLDETSGNRCYDSSPNHNDIPIFGALPTPGVIAGGRWFDNINDDLRITGNPTLSVRKALTVYLFFNPTSLNTADNFIRRDSWYRIYRTAGMAAGNVNALFYWEDTFGVGHGLLKTVNLSIGDWHFAAISCSSSGLLTQMFDDNYTTSQLANFKQISLPASTDIQWLSIGYLSHGYIDHAFLGNFYMAPSHLLKISERRYPS